jgi:hypothetical protein
MDKSAVLAPARPGQDGRSPLCATRTAPASSARGESGSYGEIADASHLRELLALCSSLGLDVVSLQQLPG